MTDRDAADPRTAEERLRAAAETAARLIATPDPVVQDGQYRHAPIAAVEAAYDVLRAALAAEPVPAPLDVERLARAIALAVDGTDGPVYQSHRKEAERIAREYAALATPPEPDTASEYGRFLAERDRLIADGADPRDLLVPDPPATPPEPGS